jgi:hypothetical protein
VYLRRREARLEKLFGVVQNRVTISRSLPAPADCAMMPRFHGQRCERAGIKPFSSNSLFKGNSAPGNPHAEEDDRRARLAIRYILCNPVITAPIPGMISIEQVDNVAKAVRERRKLDLSEQLELDRAMEEAWAKLPPDCEWLKDWEYV